MTIETAEAINAQTVTVVLIPSYVKNRLCKNSIMIINLISHKYSNGLAVTYRVTKRYNATLFPDAPSFKRLTHSVYF